MPPLNTPRRYRRRFGEVVAVVGLAGAMWGPVGSAEAGVSAGSAAKPTAKASFTATPGKSVTVGSLLGTGPASAKLDVLQGPIAQRFACSPSWWGTTGSTRLAAGWSTVNARSQPCTSASVNSTWGFNTTIPVQGYTNNGSFICRGTSYGYGTAYWYKTSRGWIWTGATANPIWQTDRNC
jgi:hypothetical protein